jgi:hypothetical protein
MPIAGSDTLVIPGSDPESTSVYLEIADQARNDSRGYLEIADQARNDI